MRNLVAGLALAVVSAAQANNDTWYASQSAAIEVDAGGQVTAVDWGTSALAAPMLERMAERVKRVEFEAASVNGVAVPSRTAVQVLLSVSGGQGGLQVRLDDVQITATVRKSAPPRYPSRELRKGISGAVMLSCRYDASGQVIAATADADSKQSAFAKAAIRAALQWQVEPQQVAGRPVAGEAQIAVTFSVDGAGLAPAYGDLKLPDGGTLRVYRAAPALDALLASQLRVRSVEHARADDMLAQVSTN